jgi:hypothetical protein
MRRFLRTSATVLSAGALLCAAGAPALAQGVGADYTLTAPALIPEPELSPRLAIGSWGPLRLAPAGSTTGSGLSLEAGEKWFARAGLGRSLDSDVVSLGGGFRFAGGDSLSMHVTRQLGQERLGLAVRYDWRQSYLRLSYEHPLRTPGAVDSLRFSAGVRF